MIVSLLAMKWNIFTSLRSLVDLDMVLVLVVLVEILVKSQWLVFLLRIALSLALIMVLGLRYALLLTLVLSLMCTLRISSCKNVSNPILIDQVYCPSGKCNKNLPSQVKISKVTSQNIKGYIKNSKCSITTL
ncbi:hypothetical protein P3S67_008091 [Capsicum chacoense]